MAARPAAGTVRPGSTGEHTTRSDVIICQLMMSFPVSFSADVRVPVAVQELDARPDSTLRLRTLTRGSYSDTHTWGGRCIQINYLLKSTNTAL